MSIKSLLFGLLIILIVGIGGFVYRNAVEHPSRPIACPLDAKVCPDGSAVGRSGPSCEFTSCPYSALPQDADLPTSTSTATSTI
ncbi:MAG: hypothetical protein Q7S95_04275 [bacterium]|nr:hypothetical protein [bacterium]